MAKSRSVCPEVIEPSYRSSIFQLRQPFLSHSDCSLLFFADKFVKGCYAVSVTGELPQDIIDSLQDRGIQYRSRDNSNR